MKTVIRRHSMSSAERRLEAVHGETAQGGGDSFQSDLASPRPPVLPHRPRAGRASRDARPLRATGGGGKTGQCAIGLGVPPDTVTGIADTRVADPFPPKPPAPGPGDLSGLAPLPIPPQQQHQGEREAPRRRLLRDNLRRRLVGSGPFNRRLDVGSDLDPLRAPG